MQKNANNLKIGHSGKVIVYNVDSKDRSFADLSKIQKAGVPASLSGKDVIKSKKQSLIKAEKKRKKEEDAKRKREEKQKLKLQKEAEKEKAKNEKNLAKKGKGKLDKEAKLQSIADKMAQLQKEMAELKNNQ
jgi:hypothetical protein